MEGPLILMGMRERLPDVVEGKLNYIRAELFYFSTDTFQIQLFVHKYNRNTNIILHLFMAHSGIQM